MLRAPWLKASLSSPSTIITLDFHVSGFKSQLSSACLAVASTYLLASLRSSFVVVPFPGAIVEGYAGCAACVGRGAGGCAGMVAGRSLAMRAPLRLRTDFFGLCLPGRPGEGGLDGVLTARLVEPVSQGFVRGLLA